MTDGWLTVEETEQVAQEKKRLSLASGDSPERAERYAQEVRDHGAWQRAQCGQG